MTEDDLEPLRQAREMMAARMRDVIDRKRRRGTLDRDDTSDALEIEAVGHCLDLTRDAYDEMAKAHGLSTLRERHEAWAAQFPPHDPDDGIPF
ncbi:hypothetical protein LX81_04226 [Palleronia aestuarii]|uniref:Uncharacterized protein n=1 Tax=Palleronia aestuarii TaxID=568105 RepID=A0A2W7PM39_9RHOB|nr:hypothetical protein [Palleronia aestuarii]PZX10389.1 hypothetical protein LX81_04226 [Palleronia aestuarii]